MKRAYLIFCVLALLTACEDKSKEINGGSYTLSGNGSGTEQVSPTVDFTFTRIAPLMVEFTNKSVGCKSYKWDFGDGTWSTGTNATHQFEQTGYDYPVTLTGTTSDGKKISKRYTIKLTTPSIWIIGYTYYAIPVENRYYKMTFKDDNWLPSDWDWDTQYSPLLTSADLPWHYDMQNPQKLINPQNHEYYSVVVYSNTKANGSGTDTKHLTIKMKVSDILTYQNELRYETSSSGATKVGISFGYEY